MSIYLEYNPCCDFKLGARLKWVIHFGLAVLLRRHVLWSLAVPNCTLNYCEICSGAYVYVMITNWFQLYLNATIQPPSGPSVIVFGVCVCVSMCGRKRFCISASHGYTCHSICSSPSKYFSISRKPFGDSNFLSNTRLFFHQCHSSLTVILLHGRQRKAWPWWGLLGSLPHEERHWNRQQ